MDGPGVLVNSYERGTDQQQQACSAAPNNAPRRWALEPKWRRAWTHGKEGQLAGLGG